MEYNYSDFTGRKLIDLAAGQSVTIQGAPAPPTQGLPIYFAAGQVVYRVPPGSVLAHEVAEFADADEAVRYCQEKNN